MLAIFVLLATLLSVNGELNDWPIIGVFAQPSTSDEGDCNGSCQYIAASYVKVIILHVLHILTLFIIEDF